MHFVYIIESLVNGDWYKGTSSDYLKRLEQHNNGESTFTRLNKPWRLIFVQAFETKTEAWREERRLKRCNKQYLMWLISQPVNLLNK